MEFQDPGLEGTGVLNKPCCGACFGAALRFIKPPNQIRFDNSAVQYAGTAVQHAGTTVQFAGSAVQYAGTAVQYAGTAVQYAGTAAQHASIASQNIMIPTISTISFDLNFEVRVLGFRV